MVGSQRQSLGLAWPMVAASLFLVSAAIAKQPPPSCERVRHALEGGKSQLQVAKDLRTSETHVKSCATQQAKTSTSTEMPTQTSQ